MPVVDLAESAADCHILGSPCREGILVVFLEMCGQLLTDFFPFGGVEIELSELFVNEFLPVAQIWLC